MNLPLVQVLLFCLLAGTHARNGTSESTRRRNAPLNHDHKNAQQMIHRSGGASLDRTQRRRLQGGAAAKNKKPPPPPPPPPPPVTPAPTKAPTKAPVPPTPPASLVTRDLGSFQLIFKAKSQDTVVNIDSNKLELVAESTFSDYISFNANSAVRAAFISSTFEATDKTSGSIRLRRIQETTINEVRYELTGSAVFLENGAPTQDEAKSLLTGAFSDGKSYAASLSADGAYSGDVDLNLEYPNGGNETIGGGGNVGGTIGGVIAAAAVVSLAAFGFVKYRKHKRLDDASYEMPEVVVKEGDGNFELMSPGFKPEQKVSPDYAFTPQFSTLSSVQGRNNTISRKQEHDDDFSFDGSAALGNDVTAGDKMLGQVLAMSSFDPVNTSHITDGFFSPMSVDTSAYTLGNEYIVDTSLVNKTMEWNMQSPESLREMDDVVEVQIESHITEPNSISGTSKINFFGSKRVVESKKTMTNGPTFVSVPKTTFPIQMARSKDGAAHYDSEDEGSYSSYGSSVDDHNTFETNVKVVVQPRVKATFPAPKAPVLPSSSSQEVDEYSLRPKSFGSERTNSRIPVSSLRNPVPSVDSKMILQNAIKAQGVSTTNFAANARRTRLEQEKARVVGAKQQSVSSQMKQETLSSQVANLRKARLQQMKSTR